MEIFIRSVGCGVNQIGEGLQDPFHGGKNSLVLRSAYEFFSPKCMGENLVLFSPLLISRFEIFVINV